MIPSDKAKELINEYGLERAKWIAAAALEESINHGQNKWFWESVIQLLEKE